MLDLGENDAKNAVTKGHGVSVDHMIHYHSLKKVSHSSILGMTLGDFLEAKENGTFDVKSNDSSLEKDMLFSQ